MDRFRTLLLDVWREACRHIRIDQAAGTIARLMAHHMPLDELSVYAFDFEQSVVQPRAVSLLRSQGAAPAPIALKPAERRRLQAWLRQSEVVLHTLGDPPHEVLTLLLGRKFDGSWLVGPLSSEHGTAGAVLLRAQAPAEFEGRHAQMLESLIEPMSAALENDHRLHELTALREAAEAEKRSALSKLGRDKLIDSIVGGDSGLRGVMERVKLVSRSDIPVLILGETGTGKEVIARAIHEQSARVKGPFIRVNCGAIPPELIDSELFGHEKGSFTGATASRRGWFERADEGTLLLDEVGELPLPAQVRLLRVLQEGSFERVGGEEPVRVDVRIVAATHRDLPAMVQNGRFREDLWYRVSGFPIVLPPLRERKGDIAALAEHFAERASRRFGLRHQSPTAGDLQLLREYPWPGNVRELASVIDRAAILGDGEGLQIARALGSPIGSAPISASAGGGSARGPGDAGESASAFDAKGDLLTLDAAARRHIEAALQHCHGRIEGPHGVARRLGINPHTLRARMRKLKIDWSRFRAV